MTYTEILSLMKYDPATDGSQTFNIQLALNDNWDKLDTWAKAVSELIGKRVTAEEVAQAIAAALKSLTPDDIDAAKQDLSNVAASVLLAAGVAAGLAKSQHNHAAGDINSGTLPIKYGGTGKTTAADARNALGAAPMYTYGTADLTEGVSPLATGTLYFQINP